MAWEALNNIAAGDDRPARHRGQRQRPVLRADHRRSRAPPRHAAYDAGLRAVPRVGPQRPRAYPGGRRADLRDPARDEEGHQGHRRAAGHVRGPRAEVRRPGRRPRRRGRRARACSGPRPSAARSSCTPSPTRAAATRRQRTTRRDHFHGIGVVDPEHRAAARREGADLRQRLRRRDGRRRQDAGRRRRDHRGDAPAGRASVPSRARSPDRVFDVGIAEQHAATSAAGMAFGGLHPVVAVYATFLNRAFDQVLMDVALHKAGGDLRPRPRRCHRRRRRQSQRHVGPVACCRSCPGCASPRRATPRRCASELREAVDVDDAPTVVRFPKGAVGDDIAAVDVVGGMDVLRRGGERDVLVVSVGAMARICLEVADRLADQGIGVTVVDPRWVKPVDAALPALAAEHRLVVTVEDNGRAGGVGSMLAQALRDAGVPTPVRDFGIPPQFLDHGSARRRAGRDRAHCPGHLAGRRRVHRRPRERSAGAGWRGRARAGLRLRRGDARPAARRLTPA